MRRLLGKIKQIIEVYLFYPSRYKGSIINSHISSSIKLGEHLVLEDNINFGTILQNIGDGVFIGRNTEINNCTQIGAYSSISNGVKVGMVNHPLKRFSTSTKFYMEKYTWVDKATFNHDKIPPTVLHEDVLISTNAVVLENVTLGRGCVVAAGAVVTKDVAPYSIVGGVPAKHIRFRFNEEQIKELMSLDFTDKVALKEINDRYTALDDVQ